jgi:hypothetical protein
MLKDDPNQFGVDFTENLLGASTAPSGKGTILLPELEEQLDLPAQAQQHQCSGGTELVGSKGRYLRPFA